MSDPRVTDKVVGVAFAAFTFDKFAHPVQAMRSALEAAVPLLAPQPVVDREAVREEVRTGLNSALCNGGHPDTGWSPSAEVDRITDAVLALFNGTAK